jgi:hypothetical protein
VLHFIPDQFPFLLVQVAHDGILLNNVKHNDRFIYFMKSIKLGKC